MKKYQIFVDSSSDLNRKLREEFEIDSFKMGVNVDSKDLDYEEYAPEVFYSWVEESEKIIKTNQMRESECRSKMLPYLNKGIDILYLACSSCVTSALEVFDKVAKELLELYPERRIVGIDSKRAGMATGMMAIDASKMQNDGKSIDEIIQQLDVNSKKIQFLRHCP